MDEQEQEEHNLYYRIARYKRELKEANICNHIGTIVIKKRRLMRTKTSKVD